MAFKGTSGTIRPAVVVSGARTPTGVFGGSLSNIDSPYLGATVIKEVLKRANVPGEAVEEVIIGTHFQAGIKANAARQCAMYAGLPDSVPAWTPNKNCATGMKAVQSAAQQVMLGEVDVIIGGGSETMSRVPYVLHGHRFGIRMGPGTFNEKGEQTVIRAELLDSMFYDGLVDPFMNYHMGITAENVAAKCGITRAMQDEFALNSHLKAQAAAEAGRFKDEIVPVEIKSRKGPALFEADETIRINAKLEDFSKLKPVFKKEGGTVTAGNASPINDAASAVLIMSEDKAKEYGLKPRLYFRGFQAAAVHPSIMGYAPVFAVQKLLAKSGLKKEDIDLFELNEAFAAQAVACAQDLKLDFNKVNVNGGAVALGHPVGSSGCRLIVTLMYEMERRNARYGIATLCIGGGQGLATLVERPA
ncbi:MAG: thiolase family protein [Desulfarculales bacterium]|jgi:acetyl-CoA C-acetyltransferase|nr:thiolase family protein [Desulfarculales bacterium]